MDLNEIQSLIKFVAKSGVHEVELETKDFKINIKSGNGKKGQEEATVIQQVPVAAMPQVQAAQPVAAPAPAPAPAPAAPAPEAPKSEPEAKDEDKYVTIKSPMIGTFYRSPSPDKPPFLNVGDDFQSGNTICIIEAMKLFNEIEAEISGKVVKVLVDDATPVEYDQPLFLIDPS